jgi:hypothetical protein
MNLSLFLLLARFERTKSALSATFSISRLPDNKRYYI